MRKARHWDTILKYADFWQTVTAETAEQVQPLVTDDVRFRDSFNDVRGRDGLRAVLAHMFETTDDPKFTITDIACGENAFYLRWTFSFKPKGKASVWSCEGITEVHLTVEGLVSAHLDHWDSGPQFFARLPLVGFLVRQIMRMMRVKS